MSGHTIYRLGPDDWQRARAVRLRALEDEPDAFGSTVERELEFSDAKWKARLEPAEVATFVATSEESEDIGLVTSAPYDGCAGLFSMWVAASVRGVGVGAGLVGAVVAWAKGQGHERVLLDVGDHNGAAIALYRKMGFRRTGVTGTLPPPRQHITEHQRELAL